MTESARSSSGSGPGRRGLLVGAAAAGAIGLPRPSLAAATALRARVFPIEDPATGPYPEQGMPRYSAASGQWGVSFSGGGPRACSAAIGQMLGLASAGVLDRVGAVSCVSGGSWFGIPFSFASGASNHALLGKVIEPGALTVSDLDTLGAASIGAALAQLTDVNLVAAALYWAFESYEYGLPADKIYSRILNSILLAPFGLDGLSKRFTLDAATHAAIVRRNPSLAGTLLEMRPNRPFLIINGTQIYPLGTDATGRPLLGLPGQILRSMEYTPLYTGCPQLFPKAGPGGVPFGGGYLESFAFDGPAPTAAPSGGIVSVQPGSYPFLLSDAMGSSSGAIASYVDYLAQVSGGFPFFRYWPIDMVGAEPSTVYSFGDGGILENTGLVALLRRGYRSVFAFVNSPYPIGSSSGGCVQGIDGQITRLFGMIPTDNLGSTQNTQIFETTAFGPVRDGLIAARAAGLPPVFASRLRVMANNPFGLAPVETQIFWIYNDRNEQWVARLPSATAALLADTDPKDYLKNFPNYATVLQNQYELLALTPRQINLMAQMWGWTVREGFHVPGQAFGTTIGT